MKKEFTSIIYHYHDELCDKIEKLVNNPPYWELINITSTCTTKQNGITEVVHYAFFQREIKD
tara:strand:+ start:1136 stop:1321 length:186 start_codon:yes stop_codon:yes gene_type:complete